MSNAYGPPSGVKPGFRFRGITSPRCFLKVAVCVLAAAGPLRSADTHFPEFPDTFYTPSGDSTVVIDTFTYPERVGRYPENWEGRSGWRQTKASPSTLYYFIESEGDNFFLRGETQGMAINFGKLTDVNVRVYNRLRWRWRVLLLPEGANEKEEDLNDSAAAVRLVFHGGFIPKTLKYVWSATLPKGTETESPSNSRTKVIVLQSGPEDVGRWLWEEVDVYADYKRLFGGEPRKVQAIAVITDSDNTGEPVRADYDDLTFLISPPDSANAEAQGDAGEPSDGEAGEESGERYDEDSSKNTESTTGKTRTQSLETTP